MLQNTQNKLQVMWFKNKKLCNTIGFKPLPGNKFKLNIGYANIVPKGRNKQNLMVRLITQNLVADTSAFLLNIPLQELGQNIFTVSDVIGEIKDEQTRQRLSLLPYSLNVREPTIDALKTVTLVAKGTGDFSVLSITDIKLIALSYELFQEKQRSSDMVTEGLVDTCPEFASDPSFPASGDAARDDGTGFIAISWKKKRRGRRGTDGTPTRIPGFYMPTADEDDGVGIEESAPSDEITNGSNGALKGKDLSNRLEDNELVRHVIEKMNIEGAEAGGEADSETIGPNSMSDNWHYMESRGTYSKDPKATSRNSESSAPRKMPNDFGLDDGWITPQNLGILEGGGVFGTTDVAEGDACHVEGEGGEGDKECDHLACLTDDYAMQNVLFKMGIPIRSSRTGKTIKTLKTYILFCKACYKTTSNMTKIFCPHCGNRSLARVAYSLAQDGTRTLHINPQRMVNKKGTKYSIPLPQGGKHPKYTVLLREDQHFPENRACRSKHTNTASVDAVLQASEALCPFVPNDVSSKAFTLLGLRHKTGAGGGPYSLRQRGPIRNEGRGKVYKAKK